VTRWNNAGTNAGIIIGCPYSVVFIKMRSIVDSIVNLVLVSLPVVFSIVVGSEAAAS
jgi:hypothetical protein